MEPKQWNRYVYVGNDPVNYVDPEGTKGCSGWDYIGAAVGVEFAFLPAEAVELAIFFGGKGPYSGAAVYGNALRAISLGAKALGVVALGVIAYNVWKKCH